MLNLTSYRQPSKFGCPASDGKVGSVDPKRQLDFGAASISKPEPSREGAQKATAGEQATAVGSSPPEEDVGEMYLADFVRLPFSPAKRPRATR